MRLLVIATKAPRRRLAVDDAVKGVSSPLPAHCMSGWGAELEAHHHPHVPCPACNARPYGVAVPPGQRGAARADELPGGRAGRRTVLDLGAPIPRADSPVDWTCAGGEIV